MIELLLEKGYGFRGSGLGEGNGGDAIADGRCLLTSWYRE
jgi:hypothetical protein